MSRREICCLPAACFLFAVLIVGAVQVNNVDAQQPPDGMIDLKLRPNSPLSTLLNEFSQQLKIQFLYSEAIGKKRVTVQTPKLVPKAAIGEILSQILREQGLALVGSKVTGFKWIVDKKDMLPFSRVMDPADVMREPGGKASPVTLEVFLKHRSAQEVSGLLRTFASKSLGSVIVAREINALLITDYAPVVRYLSEIAKLLDQPRGKVTFEFYRVENGTPKTIADSATQILSSTESAAPGADPRVAAPKGGVFPATGDQIVIVGSKDFIGRAVPLLKKLDVTTGPITRVYRLRYFSVAQLDTLLEGLVSEEDLATGYKSSADEDGNLIVVQASARIHRAIDELVKQVDVAAGSTESPIQFYRLKNASAADVLQSLLSLQDAFSTNPYLGGYSPYAPIGTSLFGNANFPFGNQNPATPNMTGGANFNNQLRTPGNPQTSQAASMRLPLTQSQAGSNNADIGRERRIQPASSQSNQSLQGIQITALPGGARVSADVATNSIIVYAPSSVQPMYKNLISALDQRRPQVLIEAKIVSIDTTNNFELGVEVSTGDRTGDRRAFAFSRSGINAVDSTNGFLSLAGSLTGFNGAIVDADVADVIVQAISSHSRGRILSSPKILVNDNSTGTLESTDERSFASTTVTPGGATTTGFSGAEAAGTIVGVTPHINADNHLLLDFSVEFSFFGQSTSTLIPPPRTAERIESSVTVPNGHTVIVGGLNRSTSRDSFTGIPWLEKIPVIRQLSSRTGKTADSRSFFLFIRPIILRDNKFADLKYVSAKPAQRAGVRSGVPKARPTLIR